MDSDRQEEQRPINEEYKRRAAAEQAVPAEQPPGEAVPTDQELRQAVRQARQTRKQLDVVAGALGGTTGGLGGTTASLLGSQGASTAEELAKQVCNPQLGQALLKELLAGVLPSPSRDQSSRSKEQLRQRVEEVLRDVVLPQFADMALTDGLRERMQLALQDALHVLYGQLVGQAAASDAPAGVADQPPAAAFFGQNKVAEDAPCVLGAAQIAEAQQRDRENWLDEQITIWNTAGRQWHSRYTRVPLNELIHTVAGPLSLRMLLSHFRPAASLALEQLNLQWAVLKEGDLGASHDDRCTLIFPQLPHSGRPPLPRHFNLMAPLGPGNLGYCSLVLDMPWRQLWVDGAQQLADGRPAPSAPHPRLTARESWRLSLVPLSRGDLRQYRPQLLLISSLGGVLGPSHLRELTPVLKTGVEVFMLRALLPDGTHQLLDIDELAAMQAAHRVEGDERLQAAAAAWARGANFAPAAWPDQLTTLLWDEWLARVQEDAAQNLLAETTPTYLGNIYYLQAKHDRDSPVMPCLSVGDAIAVEVDPASLSLQQLMPPWKTLPSSQVVNDYRVYFRPGDLVEQAWHEYHNEHAASTNWFQLFLNFKSFLAPQSPRALLSRSPTAGDK